MAEFAGPRKQRKDKGKKRGLRSRLLGSTTSGRIARGVGAAALLGGAAALSRKGVRQGISNAAKATSLGIHNARKIVPNLPGLAKQGYQHYRSEGMGHLGAAKATAQVLAPGVLGALRTPRAPKA
jgi:hypothetical protein